MENESRELQKLHEGFRFFSYLLLFLTLYLQEIRFFKLNGLFIPGIEPILEKLLRIGFLSQPIQSRLVCMGVLAITCIGTKAKKEREMEVSTLVVQILSGLILYWGSLYFTGLNTPVHLGSAFLGFVMLNIGFDNISKLINVNLMKDRFNEENESFPQEKSLKTNPFSVNLMTLFRYRNKWQEGRINIVNPFRSTIVIGTPGSGKSFSVVLPFIRQHLDKGFALCVYAIIF